MGDNSKNEPSTFQVWLIIGGIFALVAGLVRGCASSFRGKGFYDGFIAGSYWYMIIIGLLLFFFIIYIIMGGSRKK